MRTEPIASAMGIDWAARACPATDGRGCPTVSNYEYWITVVFRSWVRIRRQLASDGVV
jgi:hypothetical protein